MNAPEPAVERTILDTDILLTPIKGDNPAGEACNYEDEYEAIELEVSKLSAIELEEVNWELIADNCQLLLQEKTKDLQLSSYLAVSLFQVQGYAGLNEGLQLVDQLQNSFWHDLYPPLKRMRGRAAAINWLNTQLVKMLQEKAAAKKDAEQLEEIYTTLESINQFATEYIDQNTPNLSELLRLVNGYRSQLQNTPTPAAGQEVEQSQAQASTADTTSNKDATPQSAHATAAVIDVPSVADSSDLSKVQQSARKSLKIMAESGRSARLNDPQHFYLNRVAVWLPVTELPMNTDGKTQLQPPSEQAINGLKTQLENGENEQVILAVEDMLSSSPFWFEGNKISAQAMDDLGKRFSNARASIVSSTHAFLQRFPGLSELTFADGSAFVSDNLKQWLASETGTNAESGNAVMSATADLIQPEIITEARKLAGKSKLAEALQVLDDELNTASSGKQKFSLRILQAELCSSSERYDMATPILELLDSEQQQREMSSWEPALSIQVLQSLLNCYTKLLKKKSANSNDLQSKADSVFDRLCQLQPTAAFKYKL